MINNVSSINNIEYLALHCPIQTPISIVSNSPNITDTVNVSTNASVASVTATTKEPETNTETSSAKTQLKSIASTISSNSYISINNSLITSILNNASSEDLENYTKSSSSDLATNLSNLTTLLDKTASQAGIDSNLSEKLSSLSESLTDSTDTILTSYNNSKYTASLIANYSS